VRELRIRDAFTTGHHFRQAGFTALLKARTPQRQLHIPGNSSLNVGVWQTLFPAFAKLSRVES
jgi:hypothetical protein